MKILHIINHFGIGSGAARLVASLIPCQIEQGHQVDLIALSDAPPTYAKDMKQYGCHCFLLSNKYEPKYKPQLIIKLIPYLKQYEVVHVHLFPSIYWVAIAKMLCGAKCRLVLTEHATLNNRQGKRWIKPLERFVYHRYDAIIAISNGVKEYLHRFVDERLSVETIFNGICLERFRKAEPLSRTELGIPDETVLLIQVAGFRPEKDQLTLMRAQTRLAKNFHVMFVGTGETLEIHKQKAHELGLSERIHFMGLREDVPTLIKSSDIVVMSSHFEGFGLAAVEGMAAGKPVIGSDVPGLLEILQGGGIVFPVHNDKVLANEILRLSQEKVYAENVINKCSVRVKEYDIRIMADRYNEVYKRIINL